MGYRIRRLTARLAYGPGPRLMSTLRQWWVGFRHPDAEIRFGRGVYLGPRFSLWIPHHGRFIVEDGVEFRRDFRAEVAGDGQIIIGRDSVFTYSTLIQCSTTVEIGERCIFAQSVIVVDGQHRFRDPNFTVFEQGFTFSPVRIGNDAMVLAKATVMADLGERAVVGAGAVVTRPIPAFSVAVGVPAKVIERFHAVAEDEDVS